MSLIIPSRTSPALLPRQRSDLVAAEAQASARARLLEVARQGKTIVFDFDLTTSDPDERVCRGVRAVGEAFDIPILKRPETLPVKPHYERSSFDRMIAYAAPHLSPEQRDDAYGAFRAAYEPTAGNPDPLVSGWVQLVLEIFATGGKVAINTARPEALRAQVEEDLRLAFHAAGVTTPPEIPIFMRAPDERRDTPTAKGAHVPAIVAATGAEIGAMADDIPNNVLGVQLAALRFGFGPVLGIVPVLPGFDAPFDYRVLDLRAAGLLTVSTWEHEPPSPRPLVLAS